MNSQDTLQVSPDLVRAINLASEYQHLSVDEFLKRCVKGYMERLEDEEDYEIGLKAWQEFVESGEKAIPSEEFWREFGYED